jgi:peroxiredoxin Q/BCP
MLKVGISAPALEAKDQYNEIHKLADYRGQWVLLYFYPRDNTPGCTREACAFRDNYPHFQKIKAVVLGISTDSVASHEKFAQKFDLPFTLLADSDHQITQAYGVSSLFSRISYLIDPDGRIAKVYEAVKPETHAEEVLQDLAVLQAK